MVYEEAAGGVLEHITQYRLKLCISGSIKAFPSTLKSFHILIFRYQLYISVEKCGKAILGNVCRTSSRMLVFGISLLHTL